VCVCVCVCVWGRGGGGVPALSFSWDRTRPTTPSFSQLVVGAIKASVIHVDCRGASLPGLANVHP
jgi:hypothetical protein